MHRKAKPARFYLLRVIEGEYLHIDQRMKKNIIQDKKSLEKQGEALILVLFSVLVRHQRIKTGLHHPLIKTNLSVERKKAVFLKTIGLLKRIRLPNLMVIGDNSWGYGRFQR